MIGIYRIQSKIKSTRFYIGSSVRLKKRISTHKRMLLLGIHDNIKLQRHVNKYGMDDLVYEILMGCDKEQLIANEQFFIDAYKPWFNIAPKAGSTLGYKCTEEQAKNRRMYLMPYRGINKGRKFPEAKTGSFVICKECGISFYVKKSRLSTKIYCSSKCMGQSYSKQMVGDKNPNYRNASKTCLICGTSYINYNKQNKYCSLKCRDLAIWGDAKERQKRRDARINRRNIKRQNEKQSRIPIM